MTGVDMAEAVSRALGLHPEVLLPELEALRARGLSTTQDPFKGASDRLRQQLATLGLNQSLSIDAAIERVSQQEPGFPILGRYTVSPQRDSNLIDIYVRDFDPKWATLLATTVAEVFVKTNLERRRSATAEAAVWLGQQVDVQRLKLEDAELALQEFKEQNNIVSVSLRERSNMAMDSLKAISSRLSEIISQRAELLARLTVLESFDGDLSTLPEFKEGRLGEIHARIGDLKAELIDLRGAYTDEYPSIKLVVRKIQMMEQELKDVAANELQAMRATYQIQLATENSLKSEVAKLTALSLTLNRNQLDFERLQRDRQNSEQMYSMVLKRHKEAEMEQMMNTNNASVVKRASLPRAPIAPVRRNYILLTSFLALAFALTLAVVRDLLDSTIKSHDVLEATGHTVLGIFPMLAEEVPIKRDLLVLSDTKSSAAECARSLRTNLLFMNPEAPPAFLSVSSASPQEGKSTVAIALAVTMAQSGSKTLLVDADMRRPRLHKTFNLSTERGLSSLIIGEGDLKDVVQPTSQERLEVLPCGPIPPNPAELLHAPGFRKLLEELHQTYDRVIFDAPPVNPVSDPMVLATMVDGVVVVSSANQTKEPALAMALRRLNEVKAPIAGLVLNKVELRSGFTGGYGNYQYQLLGRLLRRRYG